MKIGFTGLDLPEGKVRYDDPLFDQIAEKCKPKKIAPYYAELLPEEFVQSDAIAVSAENALDLFINDMEKCESRIERSDDESEKELMKRCLTELESEIPLCDVEFTDRERETLQDSGFLSLKPVTIFQSKPDASEVMKKSFEKAGVIFFYTVAPPEVHAWDVKKGTDMITCAGKIHSDMARGFIKADVVSVDDFMSSHSFNDCRKKGLVKVVDKDHIIDGGEIIEIRFNV